MIRKKRKPLNKKRISIAFIITIFLSTIIYFIYSNLISFGIALIAIPILFFIYFYIKDILKKTERIKKIEGIFPDFLQLMSSNLRAGMTIDRAMLLSSRPEFAPLDAEIIQTGKDIATGKDIGSSLMAMSKRINSPKINKTILLIISGIKAGGDIAILLEETAVSMRERGFVEKKAASNVLMYVIFIFLAVSIFAPALFSLSVILVKVLTSILSGLPEIESTASLPFSLSKVSVSVNFIKYFSLIFMIVIDVFASLILGLVSKGEEKEGLRFLPIILVLSITIFFIAQIFIERFLTGIL
ncbi:hypothetical protein HOD75_01820 [archaeon]|jgi:archaeal flagellar protein FlaJ|nr:hypothetical protein [archaeon]MBT4241615.1 hypothetical protein [archaeon]MBT4418010.1 hypothetical protein [archaeon]